MGFKKEMEEVVFVSARGIQSSLIFLFLFFFLTPVLSSCCDISECLAVQGCLQGRVAGGLKTEGLFVLLASHASWF